MVRMRTLEHSGETLRQNELIVVGGLSMMVCIVRNVERLKPIAEFFPITTSPSPMTDSAATFYSIFQLFCR